MRDDPKEQTMTTKPVEKPDLSPAKNPPAVNVAWAALENAVANALAEDQSSEAIDEAASDVALAYYEWGRDDSDRAAIHAATRPRIAVPNPDAPNVVPPVAYDDQRVIDKWLGVLIVGGTYLVLLLAIVIIAAHRWLW